MSASPKGAALPELTDESFLVRYRLPRPISRAWEAACFALDEEEARYRARWCGKVALRFLATLRHASMLARDSELPIAAGSLYHLRQTVPDTVFPLELRVAGSARLYRVAGLYGGARVGTAREELAEALAGLTWLANYRILVVETWGFTVLLGPRIEYRVRLTHSLDLLRRLPPGAVLLVHPGTTAFLRLDPLVIWLRQPGTGFGHLQVLRRVDDDIGSYLEDGVPGGPCGTHVIRGRPSTGTLDLDASTASLLRSPPARFQDGTLVQGGSHRVFGLIWRGGTSDLFAAQRIDDGRAVVLKTFEYEPGVIDENWWRFANEVRFVEGVDHPNVVRPKSLQLGVHGTVHEQALVQRGSLADLLETSGVLPVAQALRIGVQLLDAISAIHQAGVIHNDLKPDNVLFDEADQARLIDFGIASLQAGARRDLRPGVPAGSRGYAAPEVLRGDVPGFRSDLFSFGVVLGQMLCGRVLEQSPTAQEIPHDGLRRLVARCLDLDPSARPSSAAELLAAIRALVDQIPVIRGVTLDIEGTLVSNFYERVPRRGLLEFLTFCVERFDRIFIYTLLSELEVRELFEDLDRQGVLPATFLGRYTYVVWPRGTEGSVKDLRRCGLPVAENAIVDDMEAMIPEDQVHRWIPVQDAADLQGPDRSLELAEELLRKMFRL
jgi:eukaryotic-like serine/threonine-protein kinase